jgi:hypothetical protein
MNKFYFKFQWVGVFLLPLAIICIPKALDLETSWIFPAFPYIFASSVFIMLLVIALITTSSSKISGKKYLPIRVTTLIESSYTTIMALFFTQGTINNSNSMLVSVLLDRGVAENTAWAANYIVQASLFTLLTLFLFTALFSSIVQRLSFKHKTIETYALPKDIGDLDKDLDKK